MGVHTGYDAQPLLLDRLCEEVRAVLWVEPHVRHKRRDLLRHRRYKARDIAIALELPVALLFLLLAPSPVKKEDQHQQQ